MRKGEVGDFKEELIENFDARLDEFIKSSKLYKSGYRHDFWVAMWKLSWNLLNLRVFLKSLLIRKSRADQFHVLLLKV